MMIDFLQIKRIFPRPRQHYFLNLQCLLFCSFCKAFCFIRATINNLDEKKIVGWLFEELSVSIVQVFHGSPHTISQISPD